MRLLGTIHIGIHAFSVFECENVKVDGVDVSGCFDPDAWCIRIKAGMGKSFQVDILLHEILHLCYWINKMVYDTGKHDEETVCRRVAPVLAEVLVNNKWVSAYIENRQ